MQGRFLFNVFIWAKNKFRRIDFKIIAPEEYLSQKKITNHPRDDS